MRTSDEPALMAALMDKVPSMSRSVYRVEMPAPSEGKAEDVSLKETVPPEHTRESRARIGAASGLSAVCPFLAEADPKLARERSRKALAYYMTLDYYHREWRKLGFVETDFADGGSDRLIDTLVAWGDKAALEERLDAYREAGANRVIVMPFDPISATVGAVEVLAPAG